MQDIYGPREDSYLILNEVRRFANGNVLDMGTGTGILAFAAAEKANNVIGVDINKRAISFAKQQAIKNKISNTRFYYSDLFSDFKKYPWKFDLIVFNPPYLPEDIREPKQSRISTTGGKKGYEVLQRFFSQTSQYLMPYGRILVVFSSLTGQDRVDKIIENHGFNYEKLKEEELFAETLYVYLIEKKEILRSAEMNGITNIKKLTKGHRGIIYIGKKGKKQVIIKHQRPDKPVISRIENEARWLKVLNKKNIGPKLIYSEKDYFVCEYIEGIQIIPYLKTANKPNIKEVITDVFNQCFVLDKTKINKEEMHNPRKHIIIKNNKPVMVDFERVHSTEKPKNTTQFCQFVSSKKILDILKQKGFKIEKMRLLAKAKKYKKDMDEKNFKEILKIIN